MYRHNSLMVVIAVSTLIAACSPAEETKVKKDPAPRVDLASLEGACNDYLTTFNRVSDKASEHFYKLFHAAGEKGAGIQSERDRWLFVGGKIEEAMLADEWSSLTLWHRNLQDHLSSIAVLSSENHYDFPEDAEAAVKMAEQLEGAYVRCMFSRNFVRGEAGRS